MPMSDIMENALDRTIVGIAPTKSKSSAIAHRTDPGFDGRISLRNLNANGQSGIFPRDNTRSFFSRLLGFLPPHVEREIGKLFCTLGFVRVGTLLWNSAGSRTETSCPTKNE
jgi:hypothetical protein